MNLFAADIEGLLSQPCLGAIGGCGSGSTVTIHLGGKVERRQPVDNARISEELRRFRGEFCLFIRGCAWRLEQNGMVTCTSKSSEEIIFSETEKLAGQTVHAIRILNSSLDLEVRFEDAQVLTLFCEEVVGDVDNYQLRVPGGWHTVHAEGRISFEKTAAAVDRPPLG
jgi:hypothetical protein